MEIQTVELILTDISFSDMLATNTDILQPWFLQMWLTMILSWKPSIDDAPLPVLQEHHVPIYSRKHMFFDPGHNKSLAEQSALIMQHNDAAWRKKMLDGDRHTTPENISLFFSESVYHTDPDAQPTAQQVPKKKVVPPNVPPPDDQSELGNFFHAKSVGQTEATTTEPLEQTSAEQTTATPAEQPLPEQTEATSAE